MNPNDHRLDINSSVYGSFVYEDLQESRES